mgnify:CR=1 FL=1
MITSVLKGSATLLKLSETLAEFSREEKSIINNLFERETRRERILGTIQKEEILANKNGQVNFDVPPKSMKKITKSSENGRETSRERE